MKMDGSYEFSELTQVEGVFVSNGKERASGKIIQILHLFPAAKAEQANRICQRLLALPEAAQRMILKYGQEGSASYFVTEPLPAGEYLQCWIERQVSPGPAAQSAPEVSGGLADQLRNLGIRPSPLAPMMPGPESPAPPAPPVAEERPGELTREFRSLYGKRPGDGKSNDPLLPPAQAFPAEPPASSGGVESGRTGNMAQSGGGGTRNTRSRAVARSRCSRTAAAQTAFAHT